MSVFKDRPKKNSKVDSRITGIEISGDGEAWEPWANTSSMDFSHMIDMMVEGERVFIRTKYVELYENGKTGMPKTGAIYELKIFEVQPIRQLIEMTQQRKLDESLTPEQKAQWSLEKELNK